MIPQRDDILEGLVEVGKLGSKAEAINPEKLGRLTLPIPAHLNALEPDVLLILGGRGAGKSHLFRLLNSPESLAALDPDHRRAHLHTAEWVSGFSTESGTQFPGELPLQQFAEGRSRAELMGFWTGLLAGRLVVQGTGQSNQQFIAQLPPELVAAFRRGVDRISEWHPLVMSELESVSAALNQLDRALASTGKYLFCTYDDLDVTAVEWEQKRALIQALLQFWLGQWRRWQRIRPKIFLRLDLFDADFLQFADASKLEGNKIILKWSAHQLYALTFKAWANQNDESRLFVESALGTQFTRQAWLGWTYPQMPSQDALRRVVHRMLGEFMGKDRKKGASFEWPPNHLQDALGEIFPRSMLNLFSLAAEDEREHRRAPENLLLAPESVSVAIEQVSERRIQELLEEFPWLSSVKSVLVGERVPMERSAMASLLGKIVSWTDRKPRSTAPEGIIDELLRIGVFRVTLDRRIHVPDIYLYGFGLRRSGGIRRPKASGS